MAGTKKSVDAFVAEVTAAARAEALAGLREPVKNLSKAVAALEAAIEGAAGRKRRGRPPGSKAAKKAGKKAGRKPSKGKGGKRTPRGALQAAIKNVLAKSGEPMKLARIKDGVLNTATFRGRNPKTLYTMIVIAAQKMPEVKKTADGLYKLGGKGAGKVAKKKAGRKVTRRRKSAKKAK